MRYFFFLFIDIGSTHKCDHDESSITSNQLPKRTKSASTTVSRSINTADKEEKEKEVAATAAAAETKKDSDEIDIDLLYYLYFLGRQRVGLQHKLNAKKPPKEFRDSYNINHPELTKGEKLYLHDICRTYSLKSMKTLKQKQYLELLKQRYVTGNLF